MSTGSSAATIRDVDSASVCPGRITSRSWSGVNRKRLQHLIQQAAMLRRHNDASLEFVWDFQKPARHRRQLDRLRARAQDERNLQGVDFIAPGSSPVPQVWQELFVPVGNAALGQVVRRNFQGDAVARQNADAIAAKLAGQVGEHGAFLIQLHAEQAAGEFLNYGSSNFNTIFFTHCPPRKIIAPRRRARCGTRE